MPADYHDLSSLGQERSGGPEDLFPPVGSSPGRFAKRAFDIGFVLLTLPFILPFAILAALAVRIESPGSPIYRSERIGRNGNPFRIYKFRSMYTDASSRGPGLTYADDPRVTRIGRHLRRTKFDEFPQVINVLLGQMSIVGPRPEDPGYVALYTPAQRQVLAARPGLTSLAQIAHRDEEEEIPSDDPETFYINEIMPAKLAIDLAYVQNWTVWLDARIFLAGLAALFRTHTLLGLDRLTSAPDRQTPHR